MSSGPRDFLSVEEIRERIRNRVRELTDSDSAQYGTPVGVREESPALALHRLNKLRLNLQNANSALNKIGAVNPRPAGWTNQIVQVVKKCIRRGLSWLLCPIQQFDSGVMEGLNETTHILEDFQTELRSILGRLEANEAALSSRHSELSVQNRSGANGGDSYAGVNARIDLLQSQVEALAKDIQDLVRNRTVKS
jgi:hypothetical protein